MPVFRLLVLTLALGVAAAPARAFEFGRLSLHGYLEVQLRGIADNFHPENAYFSQWANVLNLEGELDIAPDGWGPFDAISAFSRVAVRYDCIYTGCGVVPSWRYFGDRANRAPRNLDDARTNPYSGVLLEPDPPEPFAKGHELLTVFESPLLQELLQFAENNENAQAAVQETFGPVSDTLFAAKDIDASLGNAAFVLGPWNFKPKIDTAGALDSVPNKTLGLPLRPAVPPPHHGGLYAHGLFVPSEPFVNNFHELENIEQNYSQSEVALWHVQSQDERELKELYTDLEMFDGRLWLRLGKQSIVWGKTELFRTTDQFNPQTLALSSLPSLEESRIPLWAARGTWSFYDVGPFQDVRLELAANLDDFEPLDLGRCGIPYTVWLVCGKTFGLWAHGLAGAGIAGERRPPSPWQSLEGWEVGARVEWRWDRFSFQLSDFWGYDDAPTIDNFYAYTRNVDPKTGQPLDYQGRPLLGQSDAEILRRHPSNRQLFDLICSSTVGVASGLVDALADSCLLDLPNSMANLGLGITPATALGRVIGGTNSGGGGFNGQNIVRTLTTLAGTPTIVDLVTLNKDPADGPGTPVPGLSPVTAETALAAFLTDEQEALFGCGPFYNIDCDLQGIDLFNAEASVLIQSFPQFEPGGPVATRYVDGKLTILPGARGPTDAGYSALVDGCIGPGPIGCNDGDPGRTDPVRTLVYPPGDPNAGQPFKSELAAASYNFMKLLAALGAASGDDPECEVDDPFTCQFVRGIFAIAGSGRPEVRAGGNGSFGRRDFVWAGGSELQFRYFKRNVLGFATDFAHDSTATNWSIEATWVSGQPYGIQSEPDGYGRRDTYNLTVSVDRPTFIRFLNPSRTFFFNSQLFLRWIDDYVRNDEQTTHGPFSALGTLTVLSGYFQDRLLPGVTWVHDVRSNSGGLIAQLSYRFNQDFSATFGVAGFYGDPDELQVSIRPPLVTNVGGDYKADTRYDGLTPIAERDEVFLLLRYTF